MPPEVQRSRYSPISPTGRALWSVGPPVLRGVGRLAFRLECENRAAVPEPPFVVAANHCSHFDPPVLAAVLGTPVRFLAVDELLEASRFLGYVLPLCGAIPLSRRRSTIGAVRTALDVIHSGESVGVFPEGIRAATWGDYPHKRGAAWLACRTGVPLVPVAIRGTDQVFGLDNKLRGGRIRVVIGEPMFPDGENPYTLTAHWSAWMDNEIRRHDPGHRPD